MRIKGLSIQPVFGPEGADGGAAAPPAPTSVSTESVAAPAVPASDATSGEEFDFSLDIPDDLDVVSLPQAGTDGTAQPPAVAAPQSPAPQPTAPAAGTDTAKVEPAPAPQAPAPATPDAAAAPAAPQSGAPQPAASPGGAESAKTFSQLIEEGQAKIVDTLASSKFALTQEEQDAFATGDNSVVSKLQARVYVEAVRATAELIEQALPNMVVQALQAQAAQRSADEEFYAGPNQDLLPHRKDVVETARVLRQMNPTMPKAEFTQKLASTVRALKGLPMAAAGTQQQVPVLQPGVSMPVPQSGHRPVVSAVPSMVPVAQPNGENSWEDIDGLMAT